MEPIKSHRIINNNAGQRINVGLPISADILTHSTGTDTETDTYRTTDVHMKMLHFHKTLLNCYYGHCCQNVLEYIRFSFRMNRQTFSVIRSNDLVDMDIFSFIHLMMTKIASNLDWHRTKCRRYVKTANTPEKSVEQQAFEYSVKRMLFKHFIHSSSINFEIWHTPKNIPSFQKYM